ncbi:MAG: hypothetical protein R6V04_04475 [bacterium]
MIFDLFLIYDGLIARDIHPGCITGRDVYPEGWPGVIILNQECIYRAHY